MNSTDWKNATPAQLNFWRLANTKIAWNTITPMFYQGPVAGSEFLVYAATKIYLGLEVDFCDRLGAASATTGLITLYDEANAVMTYYRNNGLALTSADVQQFAIDTLQLQNIFFARVLVSNYSQIRFNGYKLTIV